MNAFAIVLMAVLAVANAGVLVHHSVPVVHHAVPVVHHAVPVVHTLHATPVYTKVKVVPAARSHTFSFRAPAAKLIVPVIAHRPVVHTVHTPVIAHHAVNHHVLLH